MSRVKDDDSLASEIDLGQVHDPAIIVETLPGGTQQYIISIEAVDPMGQEPKLFGIIMSDLLDHLAAAYNRTTGQDDQNLRDLIVRTMRRENSLKDKDPNRGKQRGATIMPPKKFQN